MEYYTQKSEEVLASFNVNYSLGLSEDEVKKRREHYGLNELKAKKKINPFILFLNQFKSFIIYILIFALVLSLIAGEIADSISILAILLFNAVFGFIQEFKAEKAIEALKKLSGLHALVLRNGNQMMIDVREIVPGDIIFLEEGSKVPADARIIEHFNLQVSEASLTGESVPVSKKLDVLQREVPLAERSNMVFAGTVVTRGRATLMVVGTGMSTEIGKIAGMIDSVEEEMTPLQKKLETMGHKVGIGTLLICTVIFFIGIIKDGDITHLLNGDIRFFLLAAKDWLLVAVSLAVAAVPEGLPAIVTIALAIGVMKMLRQNALIRKLPSVETLGETTVICCDKTGTLTKNEMTVRKVYTNNTMFDVQGSGYDLTGEIKAGAKSLKDSDSLIFKIGALCNNASIIKGDKISITGDPTEAALLVSAQKAGFTPEQAKAEWKKIGEDSFDPVRKMMSTIHRNMNTHKEYVFTKGAPERVLAKCDRIIINGKIRKLNQKQREDITSLNTDLATTALRVLAFAYKEHRPKEKNESKLIFVGLQGMIDPPHSQVAESIASCKKAGIRVIMITGDNLHTAEAIAHEIGIEGSAMDGISFSQLSEQDQQQTLQNTSVFARVEPQHKMAIVTLLQRQGHIVAMTGDGVNDAPAIKKANLGIAMGITGTDVTKEASDMILRDDNFVTIVNSVEQGRGIYENIQKFVNYLFSCNVGEVTVILFAILFGWPLPMTAVMLLWLNLVTDGLPALALSVDPSSQNLMDRPPRKVNGGIMDRSMIFSIIYVSTLITIAVLGLFWWAMQYYQALPQAIFLDKIQTIAFTSIIMMELARLQAVRAEYKLGLFSNKYLIIAVASSIILQLVVIYTPLSKFFGTALLSGFDWSMILGATLVVFLLNLLGASIRRRIPYFNQ
ncbi:cation-translocating P-type ATPase [Candidatus Pacearchaeota archaeon]|nr:cation-translocating P-type ATPase [Candidatus Pacearchaeota archaeon]